MNDTHDVESLMQMAAKLRLRQKEAVFNATGSFWAYCKLMHPKFYKEDRDYLKDLCNTLEALYRGTLINPNTGLAYRKLIINMPPRFGKSRTLELFVQWILGLNILTKIITVSYNSIVSGRFAKEVRNEIDLEKVESHLTVYHDIFPGTRIKRGDAAMSLWSLEGSHFTYLATSYNATITSMGADIGIIDDPIKSAIEAYNLEILEKQYDWYKNTYLSRLEEGALEIINMTRWSTKDLVGQLLAEEPELWYQIVYEAKTEGKMLCPQVMSEGNYERKKSLIDEIIFNANFHQKPVDREGTVYTRFRLYTINNIIQDGKDFIVLMDLINNIEIRRIAKFNKQKEERTKFDLFEDIIAYVDTADEGDDFLCLIIAGILKAQAFILAVLYTQRPQEYTENESARLLYENKCRRAKFESNKGGKAFARLVEDRILSEYKSRDCEITWFHQAENKTARILSNSTYVMRNIFYPGDWAKKWPAFKTSLVNFQKEGTNQHDDSCDSLTGLAEMLRGGDIVQGSEESAISIEQYFKDING